MADNTSQMITLLGLMRKQMNGAVADTMRYYGKAYGLNYGVSLPTVRQIAQSMGKDHALAQYLYKQQVRELRLAALHIAQPEQMTLSDAASWAEGLINSEVAEEMAFALLGNAIEASEIIHEWSNSGQEMLIYTSLMTAARRGELISEELINRTTTIITALPHSRIIAQGVVAMLTTAYGREEFKPSIRALADKIGSLAKEPREGFSAAEYAAEELEWRIAE